MKWQKYANETWVLDICPGLSIRVIYRDKVYKYLCPLEETWYDMLGITSVSNALRMAARLVAYRLDDEAQKLRQLYESES